MHGIMLIVTTREFIRYLSNIMNIYIFLSLACIMSVRISITCILEFRSRDDLQTSEVDGPCHHDDGHACPVDNQLIGLATLDSP